MKSIAALQAVVTAALFDGEPSDAELDAIETEMPAILADVVLLDAQIMTIDRTPSELDERRIRRARRRVAGQDRPRQGGSPCTATPRSSPVSVPSCSAGGAVRLSRSRVDPGVRRNERSGEAAAARGAQALADAQSRPTPAQALAAAKAIRGTAPRADRPAAREARKQAEQRVRLAERAVHKAEQS
ncbi:hypothetical protein SMICM304S_11852 [Streptomyces microflavus]